MKLENCYPDIIEEAIKNKTPLFIPVGTIEYHSAHMPLGTDTQTAYYFLEELEKRRDIIIAPPVWYGCASYAVKGPEGGSIDMDGRVLNDFMYNIYMSLLKTGFRNIIVIVAHQIEEINPTEAACIDAARRAIFKFLEETRGIGWWGDNKMKDFYGTLDSDDNPWNWIRVRPMHFRNLEIAGDHAGEWETSWLWALKPELIREDKIGTSDDWFVETAKDASLEKGREVINKVHKLWDEFLG